MQCDKVKLYLLNKTTKQARDYRQKRPTNQIKLTNKSVNINLKGTLLKSSTVIKAFMGKAVSKPWSIVVLTITLIVILSGQMQYTTTPFVRVLLIAQFFAGWPIYLDHLLDFFLLLSSALCGRTNATE